MHKKDRLTRRLCFASIVTTMMLLLGTGAVSTAQAQMPGCPPEEVGCGNWTPMTKVIPFGSCDMTIVAQWRVCNGILQYQYLSFSIAGDCTFWADSTLQQLADLFLIGQANKDAENTLGFSMPTCPTTQLQVEFYVSSCYIWQKCT